MPELFRHWKFLRAAWKAEPAPIGQDELIELEGTLELNARRGRSEPVRLTTRWMSPDSVLFTTATRLREGDRLNLTLRLDRNSTLQIRAVVHWTTMTREGRLGRLQLLTPPRH
ncbi:MAG: hypothetical protein AB1758_28340, partial [Candidatus Eremiobacterota bacterium]